MVLCGWFCLCFWCINLWWFCFLMIWVWLVCWSLFWWICTRRGVARRWRSWRVGSISMMLWWCLIILMFVVLCVCGIGVSEWCECWYWCVEFFWVSCWVDVVIGIDWLGLNVMFGWWCCVLCVWCCEMKDGVMGCWWLFLFVCVGWRCCGCGMFGRWMCLCRRARRRCA